MEKVTLPVNGMTCASCSTHVQRALEATPGVATASVNLMLHNAVVTFDDAALTPTDLVSVIEQTGYGSSLPEPGPVGARRAGGPGPRAGGRVPRPAR